MLKIQAMRPTFYGLEMHLVKIYRFINEFKTTVVIIDPISNLTDIGNYMQIKSFMMRLVDFFKTHILIP